MALHRIAPLRPAALRHAPPRPATQRHAPQRNAFNHSTDSNHNTKADQ